MIRFGLGLIIGGLAVDFYNQKQAEIHNYAKKGGLFNAIAADIDDPRRKHDAGKIDPRKVSFIPKFSKRRRI